MRTLYEDHNYSSRILQLSRLSVFGCALQEVLNPHMYVRHNDSRDAYQPSSLVIKRFNIPTREQSNRTC